MTDLGWSPAKCARKQAEIDALRVEIHALKRGLTEALDTIRDDWEIGSPDEDPNYVRLRALVGWAYLRGRQ